MNRLRRRLLGTALAVATSLACFSSAPRGGGGRGLSHPPGDPGRARGGRRDHRHRGAPHRGRDHEGAWPAVHRRQQGRCQRQHRHPHRRPGRAGRLHAAADLLRLPGHQSGAVQEAGLGPDRELRPCGADGQVALPHRRQEGSSGEYPAGVHRIRQGEAGRGDLRLLRARARCSRSAPSSCSSSPARRWCTSPTRALARR